MPKQILVTFILINIFFACNQPAKTKKNTDALEAGREFIDASLKGDYDYAKVYLLPDSTNLMYFERFVEFDNKKTSSEKNGYKNANILIDSTQNISDSESIINYSNTYKKEPAKLKLVKKNNEWLVDFKFTFLGNM